MKFKFALTSVALTSLLMVSACGSAVSTNAQNAQPVAKAEAPVTPPPVQAKTEVEKPITTIDVKDVLKNNSDRIFFVTNSAAISNESSATIQAIAPTLAKAQNTKYVIEGHADERGTRAYNLALGKERATALKEALVSNDVNADDITTVTYGKDRPFNPAHNAHAWSQNRRAVIVPSDK